MMKRPAQAVPILALVILLALSVGASCVGDNTDASPPTPATSSPTASPLPTSPSAPDLWSSEGGLTLDLPTPSTEGAMSVEEAIESRRSIREFTSEPLSLSELGQLLWSAQGVTAESGARAAPSAGGTYPLEIYVAVGRVNGLEPGVYRYRPEDHTLAELAKGDVRPELMQVSLDQAWVGSGAVDVIIAGVYARTTERYAERGIRYVHLEAGHAAENLCLQATALGLGAVTVGAFSDEDVRETIGLTAEEQPLYVIPVGRPATAR